MISQPFPNGACYRLEARSGEEVLIVYLPDAYNGCMSNAFWVLQGGIGLDDLIRVIVGKATPPQSPFCQYSGMGHFNSWNKINT